MQKSKRTHVPWTTHELARLKQLYPTMTRGQLADQFPRHTVRAIVSQAGAFKLKKTQARRDQNFWKKIADDHAYQIPWFEAQARQGRAASEQTLGPA